MPAQLLTLPREIRDKIVGFALSFDEAAPLDPAHSAENRLPLQDRHSKSWSYGPANVHFKRLVKRPLWASTRLSLLLVSRQLSAETRDNIERLSARPHTIDVMLVDEKALWPTWTSFPAPIHHIKELTATFRVFGTNAENRRRSFSPGCGGPPQLTWCFYYLLEWIVKHGPLSEYPPKDIDPGNNASVDKGFTIDVLTLDFLTPTETETQRLAPEELEFWLWAAGPPVYSLHGDGQAGLTREEIEKALIRPEMLASFVGNHLSTLLYMNYHTAEFGGILYERVGTIRTCVDGELKRTLDLSFYLDLLEFTENPHDTMGHMSDREKRLPAFREWKEKALEMRKAAGFSASVSPVSSRLGRRRPRS